jgi:hypothetical protein
MAIKDLYKEAEDEKENEVDDDVVTMPMADYVKEHIHLIKVLRNGDKKALEAEAVKQEKEMADELGD